MDNWRTSRSILIGQSTIRSSPGKHLNTNFKVRYHTNMLASKNHSGLTLVEMLISMAILAIFLTITIPYLLGTRNQNLLQANTDQLATVLQMARQFALSAKPGLTAIKVDITSADPVTLIYTPSDNPPRTFTLSSGVILTAPPPPHTISFDKLYGTVSTSTQITLEYKGYTSSVTVEKSGDISTTKALKI